MSDNNHGSGGDTQVEMIQYGKNYCKYCGKPLQKDAAFCSSCGRLQSNVPVQQLRRPVAQVQTNFTSPYMVLLLHSWDLFSAGCHLLISSCGSWGFFFLS